MESLSTLVQSPLFSRLFIVIASLAMVAFFWWRAGSIHSVLERLWRLVAGKADAHDPALKTMLITSRDLEKFQFIYRLKVETLAEVRKLAEWMDEHGVGMSRLQKMRPWVNVRSPEIVVQPPKYFRRAKFAIAAIAFLVMIGVSQFAASPNAYLQMRASKTWFKTDATSVKAPLEGWSFNAADCTADKSKITRTTGFLDTETDVICKALEEESLKPLVKQGVEFQAWTGIAVILLALAVIFFNLLAMIAAQEALDLRKRLYAVNRNC